MVVVWEYVHEGSRGENAAGLPIARRGTRRMPDGAGTVPVGGLPMGSHVGRSDVG